LIVCEGFGDATFADALLEHHNIMNYQVGCPTRRTVGGEGKSNISKFLQAVAAHPNAKNLRGIVVMIDADDDPVGSFRQAAADLFDADFMPPGSPYAGSGGTDPRTAVVLIPPNGGTGTLVRTSKDSLLSHRFISVSWRTTAHPAVANSA
jgi:hypothetical protein